MAAPKPFLKWVGGKRQLLGRLRTFVPDGYDRYFEPFVGGGALFFDLQPKRSVLSDVNAEIIDCYTAVRDHIDPLIGALKQHHYDERHYYAVRDADPAAMTLVERAARTIFLNRTGFNGLYRVNRAGKFNVPFGRYTSPRICNEPNLRSCSAALATAELCVQDFALVCARATKGDFVYLDPPYVPVSRTSAFTAYARGGFGPEDQRRLSAVFGQLSDRGVTVVLSNSDVPEVRKLYADFVIEKVHASRAVNSDASRRGRVCEVVVTGVGPVPARRRKAAVKAGERGALRHPEGGAASADKRRDGNA